MSYFGEKFLENNINGYILGDLTLSILFNKKELEKLHFYLMEYNSDFFQYIKNPTEETKYFVIQKNGWAIKYIENLTNRRNKRNSY